MARDPRGNDARCRTALLWKWSLRDNKTGMQAAHPATELQLRARPSPPACSCCKLAVGSTGVHMPLLRRSPTPAALTSTKSNVQVPIFEILHTY